MSEAKKVKSLGRLEGEGIGEVAVEEGGAVKQRVDHIELHVGDRRGMEGLRSECWRASRGYGELTRPHLRLDCDVYLPVR